MPIEFGKWNSIYNRYADWTDQAVWPTLLDNFNEATLIIPSKKNRIVQRNTDWYTYKDRNLVERFINKIKQYRRIFTRYEKYASRYMAFLSFAATSIWLK